MLFGHRNRRRRRRFRIAKFLFQDTRQCSTWCINRVGYLRIISEVKSNVFTAKILFRFIKCKCGIKCIVKGTNVTLRNLGLKFTWFWCPFYPKKSWTWTWHVWWTNQFHLADFRLFFGRRNRRRSRRRGWGQRRRCKPRRRRRIRTAKFLFQDTRQCLSWCKNRIGYLWIIGEIESNVSTA